MKFAADADRGQEFEPRPIRMQTNYSETSAKNQQNLTKHRIPLRPSEMPEWRQFLDGPTATAGSSGSNPWLGREARQSWGRGGDERIDGRLLDRTDPRYSPGMDLAAYDRPPPIKGIERKPTDLVLTIKRECESPAPA